MFLRIKGLPHIGIGVQLASEGQPRLVHPIEQLFRPFLVQLSAFYQIGGAGEASADDQHNLAPDAEIIIAVALLITLQNLPLLGQPPAVLLDQAVLAGVEGLDPGLSRQIAFHVAFRNGLHYLYEPPDHLPLLS